MDKILECNKYLLETLHSDVLSGPSFEYKKNNGDVITSCNKDVEIRQDFPVAGIATLTSEIDVSRRFFLFRSIKQLSYPFLKSFQKTDYQFQLNLKIF